MVARGDAICALKVLIAYLELSGTQDNNVIQDWGCHRPEVNVGWTAVVFLVWLGVGHGHNVYVVISHLIIFQP